MKLAEDNRSGSLEAKGDSDELLAQWGNAWATGTIGETGIMV